MAQLIDLEEALHEVKNRMLIPNLREAISCYYASSYRACIILCFNSLVDDLIDKLKVLKDVNNDAKNIYKNISELIEKQVSYENPLIEQLVKAKIFSELDGEIYKIFQKLRHKSAHPSGFDPSAECARFIFTEIINRFLSKVSLQTTARVDKLMSDITEGNFFIGIDIDDNAKVVKSEISDIHPDALPQLINRVYKKYTENELKKQNPYMTFLNSIAWNNDSRINEILINYVIKPNISKQNHEYLFVTILNSNVSIFNGLDHISATKIINNIKLCIQQPENNISNTALRNPYGAILEICNGDKCELHKLASEMMHVYIENKKRLCFFMKQIEKSITSNGRDAYINLFNLIIKEFESNDIKKVDEICEILIEDDQQSFEGINSGRAFLLILKLACNPSNSQMIKDIIEQDFDSLAYIKEKAMEYYSQDDFYSTKIGKSLTSEEIDTIKNIFS